MANKIVIVFTPCEVLPGNGYRVYYRPVGSLIPYRLSEGYTTSPINIVDTSDADGTQYEGYLQADYGDGRDCPHVPFAPEAPAEYGITIDVYRIGSGCSEQHETGLIFHFDTPLVAPITIKLANARKGATNVLYNIADGLSTLGVANPWSPMSFESGFTWDLTIPAGVTSYDTGLIQQSLSGIFSLPCCNPLNSNFSKIYLYMKVVDAAGQVLNIAGDRVGDYFCPGIEFKFLVV